MKKRLWFSFCLSVVILSSCTAADEEKDLGEDAGLVALGLPQISVASRTFSDTLTVEISSTREFSKIYYTLDGTLPDEVSGQRYVAPIVVSETSELRAINIDGAERSGVVSENYFRVSAEIQNYESNLPLVVIDNMGQGKIPDKEWTREKNSGIGIVQVERQKAFIQIFDRDGDRSSLSAVPEHSARMGIRVRGAFSSTWDPQPFSLEIRQSGSEQDRAVSFLDMPADSDWILYHPFPEYDRTMLYNTFIWELAGQTGRYAPRFRFVEVFLNTDGGALDMDDRLGIYALHEKVKPGEERIPITPLDDEGREGGWLLSINRLDAEPASGFPTENGAMSPQYFHTPGPDGILETPPNQPGVGDDIPRQSNGYLNFESPNGYSISATQRSVIENWFAEFESVLYDDELWLDPVNGYRKYLNVQDFIDYFHLLNLAKQGDGLLISMYPWVSNAPRTLHMGPLWDFNNNAYNDVFDRPLLFRPDRLWYGRLFDDPTFETEFLARWFELRESVLSEQNMDAIIDSQSSEISVGLATRQGLTMMEWQSRLEGMKQNLTIRAQWLDGQFATPLP